MKKINHLIYFLISLIIILQGCSRVQSEEILNDENNEIPNFDDINQDKKTNIRNAQPFYPMNETIEDIQEQINYLKSRVIEYESKINRVVLDPDLLKMIKTPLINHEIELIIIITSLIMNYEQ